MDKKAIIGFVLLMLLLILWPYWNRLFYNPAPVAPPHTSTANESVDTAKAETAPPISPLSAAEPETAFKPPAEPERLIRVENEDYIAIFSSYGGLLKSFQLKKYQTETQGNGHGPVMLVDSTLSSIGDAPRALTLSSNDSPYPVNRLAYEVEGSDIFLKKGDPPAKLAFVVRTPEGAYLRREYQFSAKGYRYAVSLDIKKPAAFGLDKKITLGWFKPIMPTEKDLHEDLGKFAAFYSMGGEVVEHSKIDREHASQVFTGSSRWVAVRTKYFANAIIAGTLEGDEVAINGTQATLIGPDKKQHNWKKFAAGITYDIKGDSFAADFQIYSGPLDYYLLEDIGFGLGKLVDLGWAPFRPFAIAILWIFVNLHKILFNYGVVIIVFSVLMKLVFWPLTRKSSTSMYRMKELAPKLQELRARYKDDPQKMNMETMKLYREFGVNPFSSCLPLLIQLPIFWALFSVLKNSIEMRAAELILWITDLSQKDPYYVLPIVMGVSMYIQQKLTITDPKQKLLVYFMPILFTFLFAQWPSGLVLYWTVFNVVSIFEQLSIKRKFEAEKPVAS